MDDKECDVENHATKNPLTHSAPCVSVLMPSLNTARYIREALDSVVNQTLKDIEIICIDAGSTDGTREIIGEYAERDSRIRVIDSPVKSYGYQMNVGLDAAKGSYIGIVEPDDYILPEMYEELYSQAISENLDVIKGNCNFCSFREDGSKASRFQPLFTAWGQNTDRYGHVFDMVDVPETVREGALGTWSGIYRREFLLGNHVRYNESPGASFQDVGLYFQTALCARRFKAVEKAYYNYRVDNPSSSRNDKSKLMVLWKEYEALFKWLGGYPEKERLDVFEPYLQGRMLSGCVWIIERIGFESSLELVEKAKRRFVQFTSTGLVKQCHLPVREWNILVSWSVRDLISWKIFMPYLFVRRIVARRYGFALPKHSRFKELVPFFLHPQYRRCRF